MTAAFSPRQSAANGCKLRPDTPAACAALHGRSVRAAPAMRRLPARPAGRRQRAPPRGSAPRLAPGAGRLMNACAHRLAEWPKPAWLGSGQCALPRIWTNDAEPHTRKHPANRAGGDAELGRGKSSCREHVAS
jgi:hypothetical protein